MDYYKAKRREWLALTQDDHIKGVFYAKMFGVLGALVLLGAIMSLITK